MSDHAGTEPIPGPPPLPVIGNLLDIDRSATIKSWVELADVWGPIYKLRLAGADRFFVTGYDLVNELCSRKDFVKKPVGVIKAQQAMTPEGLFTAEHEQESWWTAHRVLVPSLGPMSVRSMFSEMHDVISQLVLKWARFGEEARIDVPADFTRLTLDTIALCAMDIRFNSFYKDEMHPFVDAMISSFVESQQRSVRPGWLTNMFWRANQQFQANDKYLHDIAAEMIAKRRANPTNKKDLVNAMLLGKDPVTGKQLSDQTIMDNMITFLVAGHETTSGLLSFVFALLLMNPAKYTKLREEIDRVLGQGPFLEDHLTQLPYTKACLREALRIHPPAAGFSLSPNTDGPVVVGGKYVLQPNDACVILLGKLHFDPEIWGDDARDFKPERMLEENFSKLPPNCFKPFGNGMRLCIGSDFAMQEAVMAVAILMQKFDFKLADPDYQMKIKQTATMKPEDLFMHAKLRPHVDPLTLQSELFHGEGKPLSTDILDAGGDTNGAVVSGKGLSPMSVFYGSNTGTCEGFAHRLAKIALRHGFKCTVQTLNEAAEKDLPTDWPVIILSSTHYEGQPPDNASKFISKLEAQSSCHGVKYAIFGCGNREWQDTYQAIPIRIEEILKKLGARSLAARGLCDAGQGDMIGDFDLWLADSLWPGLAEFYGSKALENKVDAVPEDVAAYAPEAVSGQFAGKIKAVKALTSDEPRPKYHMEVELPADVTYDVGDYLDVYPANSQEDIAVLSSVVQNLKQNTSSPIVSMLSSSHELGQPSTPRQLDHLITSCKDQGQKTALESLRSSLSNVPSTHWPSVLRLLQQYPSISLPLEKLASMLPPTRPRSYSISSSPFATPGQCSLTWSIISRTSVGTDSADEAPEITIPGLASTYLSGTKPGDLLTCAVRPGHSRFRPPPDLTTPIIMVCAGAGIAPFAGFIAHRAEQARRDPTLRSGNGLAPALLYMGCRSKKHAPYAAELEKSGVVDVRYAYSQGTDEEGEFKGYVQDRVWAEREELIDLWDKGARIYVCGSRAISVGCKEVMRKIYREVASARCGAKSDAEVDEWWIEILRERYAVDVF